MEFPKTKARYAYDWSEIAAYIEDKHDCKLRDFEGRYASADIDDTKVYHDYWHFLIDRFEPHNGSYIYLDADLLGNAAPWQEKITRWILEEFGEVVPVWVEW